MRQVSISPQNEELGQCPLAVHGPLSFAFPNVDQCKRLFTDQTQTAL